MTTTAPTSHSVEGTSPQRHADDAAEKLERSNGERSRIAAVAKRCSSQRKRNAQTVPKQVRRGLSATASTAQLRSAIWKRALAIANRFRVLRTVDVAIACFPERDFKAALTAAQRATRGLVKAGLLRRYRTDRFQTVYGLTQPGARWLQEAGVEAKASVRRVSDMSNPEHALWAQFIVLAAEARGLKASTEAELLRTLSTSTADTQHGKQGLLRVESKTPNSSVHHYLRPDAVFDEHDGAAWIEIDRSARGANRAAALRTLALGVGAKLVDGRALRRVVVFTRTERIRGRVMAVLRGVAEQSRESALVRGRRMLKEVEADSFEVWMTIDRRHADGRSSLVDKLAGHVIVQALPTWLPRLRLDGRGESSTAGWLGENYLPYRRPHGLPAWDTPQSPLLGTAQLGRLTGQRPSG